MGDYIIRTAADIIQNCFSPIGNCYRIGGDEFAVICTNHTENEVKDALKRLNESVSKHNDVADPEKNLTLACGYAFRETQHTTIEQLFKKADKAMYLCKRAQKSS